MKEMIEGVHLIFLILIVDVDGISMSVDFSFKVLPPGRLVVEINTVPQMHLKVNDVS